MEQFKYLGTTLTNQNSIHEGIESILKSGNACCLSVQNHLSSSLLSKIKIYKTIILSVVFSGCDTWSLALREECRLRVSENRVLRRIFGSKWDKITGEWRRPHKKGLYDLYSSPTIRVIKSRRMGWPGHVARMGESRGGKPWGKKPLGRPRHR